MIAVPTDLDLLIKYSKDNPVTDKDINDAINEMQKLKNEKKKILKIEIDNKK